MTCSKCYALGCGGECEPDAPRSAVPEHISAEIVALAQRGSVTREEYEALRMNSWEREYLLEHLNDDALCAIVEHCLNNASVDQRRPYTTYNNALLGMYTPELVKRLRRRTP